MTRSALCGLLVLGAVSACTSFDDIARGVCGNGLLEPGEDCDSPAATCVACAVTCGSAAECPNAGYACGVDNRCHAPSGKLAPDTTPALDLVDDIRVSDLDGDGIGDVLGVSSSAIDVRFGDAQAALVSRLAIVTPEQSGPPAFGDLDGDGALDVSIVTPDGIVAYTSQLAVLAPAVSFFPLDGSGGTTLQLFPVASFAFGAIVEEATSHRLVVAMSPVDRVAFSITPALAPLCGLAAAGFDPSGVDVQTLPRNSDNSTDLVLSVFTGGPPGANLCVVAVHFDAVPLLGNVRDIHFYPITPTTPVVTTKPVWVDLDFDGAGLSDKCPGLVDGDGGPALVQWDGSLTGLGGPHCALAGPSAVPAFGDGSVGSHVVGRIPVVPTSLLFPNDVLVMSNGLYINTAFGMLRVYRSERELTGVASGDLDGNGSTDAVLRADADGLDVVYRADANNTPGYIVQHVGTTGTVTSTQIADYDGNGLADIAFTETLIGHDGLSVAYSDPGHTLTIAHQGVFAKVRSVSTVDVSDTSDPSALIADLIVLEDLGGVLGATLLDGSPQRTMISFFDPRRTGDALAGAAFRQLAVGHFNPAAPASPYHDLVAFIPGSASPTAGTTDSTAYRLDGTANGLDPQDPVNIAHGQVITNLAGCSFGPSSAPCVQSTLLTPWPTAADHDLLSASTSR